MASALIHIAVAKKLEKYLKINNLNDYYLGTIAPDISKQIGESKTKSHFLHNTKDDIPNIELFIKKYPNFKSNSFDLGYFIHLYTDKIWFEEFLSNLTDYKTKIKLLNNTIYLTKSEEITKLVYDNYTSLNLKIIDAYNLDLSLFYEEFKKPTTEIDEIPIDKLNILLDKMGIIVENSSIKKEKIFTMEDINSFINKCQKEILKKINY